MLSARSPTKLSLWAGLWFKMRLRSKRKQRTSGTDLTWPVYGDIGYQMKLLFWRSASRSPDDVVEIVVSIAENNDPLIIIDVGGSTPSRISLKDFHIPSSRKGVFNLLLNKDGLTIDVGAKSLDGLVNKVDSLSFLSVGDSISMAPHHRVSLSSSDWTLGETSLFFNQLLNRISSESHSWCHKG